MTYVVFTPAAAPPVTTAEAAAHCRVSGSGDNTWLASAVLGATGLVEKYLKRSIINQTIDLYLDAFPGRADRNEWDRGSDDDAIDLRLPPIVSVTGVYYTPGGGAEQTLAAAQYLVDTKSEPGRIVPAHGCTWPTDVLNPINGVRVRYVAGYGAASTNVPEQIRQAIKIQVAEWYENRGDDPSLAVGAFNTQPLGKACLTALAGLVKHRI